MCSPALKAATAALQATFGPYLGSRPEVEHDFYGRGILVGLPACHINDQQPMGTVEFASQPDGHFPDYHDLKGLKLVLYSPADGRAVLSKQNSQPEHLTPELAEFFGMMMFVGGDAAMLEMERMAKVVDAARALGIALNLPAGSYVRKELTNA